MDDGSSRNFLTSLKQEWQLLWASIQENENNEQENEDDQDFHLTPEALREIKGTLSVRRLNLNRSLEKIRKDIDLCTAKYESLKLVGRDEPNLLKRIEKLNEEGDKIQTELNELTDKLRALHEYERELEV